MEIERSSLDEQEISQELEVSFPVQLLRHRPDVLAAEYGLVNAFELTNVARSQFYPSVLTATREVSDALYSFEAAEESIDDYSDFVDFPAKSPYIWVLNPKKP